MATTSNAAICGKDSKSFKESTVHHEKVNAKHSDDPGLSLLCCQRLGGVIQGCAQRVNRTGHSARAATQP